MEHVRVIEELFSKEGVSIPKGFTEEDVNANAPRLFQNTMMLQYIKHMTKGGLATYGTTLPNMVREDVREFFSDALRSTTDLYNESTSLLVSKGIEIRPPYIPYQKQVDFVEKQSFIAGWFGEQRPLSGLEIMHLYANIQTNKLGEALAVGFAQAASSKEIRKYMERGKEIAKKHRTVFADHLTRYDLPVPMTWDHEITTSKVSPFSDKLLMYHFGVLNGESIGNYGMAMSMCQRRDLATDYARLSAEVGQYADDGLNIMIDHQWLERPPEAADRVELSRSKKS